MGALQTRYRLSRTGRARRTPNLGLVLFSFFLKDVRLRYVKAEYVLFLIFKKNFPLFIVVLKVVLKPGRPLEPFFGGRKRWAPM